MADDRRTRKSESLVEVRTVLSRARAAIERLDYVAKEPYQEHVKQFPKQGWHALDPEHDLLRARLVEVERLLEPWGKR